MKKQRQFNWHPNEVHGLSGGHVSLL
jgi:hypothetical protein